MTIQEAAEVLEELKKPGRFTILAPGVVYDAIKIAIDALGSDNVGGKDDLISRKAAIETALTYIVEYCGAAFDEDMQRTLKERLDSLPSVQPEQSSEIQDILDYLDTVLHPIVSPDHWNVYSELHDMISTLPSAQPETTHIVGDSIKDSSFFYCEECGEPVHSEYNYCPRCGRKL